MPLLNDDIFYVSEDERVEVFETAYFERFGRFANPGRQHALLEGLKALQENGAEVEAMAAAIAANLREQNPGKDLNSILRDQVQAKVADGLHAGADAAMSQLLNRLVAREVVKASVGGAVDQAGRRGAIVAMQTAGLSGAQGAYVAVDGIQLASCAPAVSAAVGKGVMDAAKKLGIQYHVKNCRSRGDKGIANGIAPSREVTANAVEATKYAAKYAINQVVNVMGYTGFDIAGPNDNWCFVEIGRVHENKVCVCTYNESDPLCVKSYWKEYKSDGDELVMSAGQARDGGFQVKVWDNNDKEICHLKDVKYRDFVRVYLGDRLCDTDQGWKWCVLYAKGENHGAESGQVKRISCPFEGIRFPWLISV